MISPTVAVVMCTYNGEKYLRQQLDSILAQTYPIQELIVQDDCSTDATLAILQEYEAKVPFMKVIENTHNLGFNLNFKTACMRATTDLIAISDQDDVSGCLRKYRNKCRLLETTTSVFPPIYGENVWKQPILSVHNTHRKHYCLQVSQAIPCLYAVNSFKEKKSG